MGESDARSVIPAHLRKALVINPDINKQLFLDDHSIEHMSGVVRTLHSPEKQGPVIRPDRSQGQTQLQSRSVPQWNSEIGNWEWWYWTGYKVPPYGRRRDTNMDLMTYATSPDGINWQKPSLGLFEWNGSMDNNISYEPREGGRAIYHIIRDEREEDPKRRYKGLFGKTDKALGVSSDGFTWQILDTPRIPTRDESHFLLDQSTAQYLAFVKQHTAWGRSVWVTSSKDYTNWTELRLVMHSDKIDQENRKQRVQAAIDDPAYLSPPLVDGMDRIAEVYQMAVMPYEGLYIGFPVLFNPAAALPEPYGNYTALNQVELTVSRDLYHWDRVAERQVFIGIDSWDGVNYGTTQNLLCGAPHVHEDKEIWIYYNAMRFRAPMEFYDERYHPYFEDASALCLAKLRLDGFVSLDAKTEGMILSKPFATTGGDLYVNVDAHQGQVRAEVLNADTMEPLPGLALDACHAVTGDDLNASFTWNADLPLRSQAPVRVRFELKDANLYSFWMGASRQ